MIPTEIKGLLLIKEVIFSTNMLFVLFKYIIVFSFIYCFFNDSVYLYCSDLYIINEMNPNISDKNNIELAIRTKTINNHKKCRENNSNQNKKLT